MDNIYILYIFYFTQQMHKLISTNEIYYRRNKIMIYRLSSEKKYVPSF